MSGLSVTAARRVYGFENLRERAQKVDTAIEVSDISTDESDSGEEWTSLSEVEEDSTLIQSEVSWPEKSALLRLLQDCKFYWFELVSYIDKMKIYQELFGRAKTR